ATIRAALLPEEIRQKISDTTSLWILLEQKMFSQDGSPAFCSGLVVPISLILLMVPFATGGFFAGDPSAKLPCNQPDRTSRGVNRLRDIAKPRRFN
ncbi:MAG TPA: hypothetical protein VK192_05380, partial [Sphingomicrobium sp.]|nr:hypothetical protein [Sphingomicrobium sp.]